MPKIGTQPKKLLVTGNISQWDFFLFWVSILNKIAGKYSGFFTNHSCQIWDYFDIKKNKDDIRRWRCSSLNHEKSLLFVFILFGLMLCCLMRIHAQIPWMTFCWTYLPWLTPVDFMGFGEKTNICVICLSALSAFTGRRVRLNEDESRPLS